MNIVADAPWYANIIGYLAEGAGTLALLALGWVFTKLGINVGNDQKEQLRKWVEEIARGGILWAALKLGIKLDGNVTEANKQKIITLAATEYMPVHAADSVKKLGGDANDVTAMKQIVAAKGADLLVKPLAQVGTPAPVPVTVEPAKAQPKAK